MKFIGLTLSIALLAVTMFLGTRTAAVQTAEEELKRACNCFMSNGVGGRQAGDGCYPFDCEWKPILTAE